MSVVHVIVGPDQHGVVRHAEQVAQACGHGIVRATSVDDVPQVDASVVHVPFADRLFATTGEAAAEEFLRLAAVLTAGGASLSVTLHDVPDPSAADALSRRRAGAYAQVVAASTAVVVNSRADLAAVQDVAARRPGPRLLRLIDLPIDAVPRPPRPAALDGSVTVLGFLYPDRGYEDVLRALPPGVGLTALGRPSDGHDDLPVALGVLAAGLGRRFTITGWCDDDALAAHLARAAVPVAPNRRVTSSGSIGTWLAHGRRPLVPATPYTRELAGRLPGALTLYDPDAPGALAAAVALAVAEPERTWLPAGTAVGPSTSEVAARYTELLAAAEPAAVVTVAGRTTVPANRWDLLAPASPASVSVVIPYYDAQADLDRVLTALTLQTVRERLEVIVADDGSPTPPDVSAAGDLPVRVLRQPRRGFGASRARNLGLQHARGEVVAFLDGDTVPEPDYLRRLTDRAATGDVLAVGRRRHAELDGWSTDGVAEWLAGTAPGPPVLTEPAWLAEAYTASANLLDADARSYRYVISAVLAARRELLRRIGGFDERFDHYGGEDWELAHRAWNAGALLAHVPDAIAWHHGPDWAGRGAARAPKDVETATLARLLPDPVARGGGQWTYPHVVVLLATQDETAATACVRSALAAGADCGFWLDDGSVGLRHRCVHRGPPPPDVLARAGVVAVVPAAGDLSELTALASLAVEVGSVHTSGVDLYSSRALARSATAMCRTSDPPPPEEVVGRLFGGHDRVAG